MSGDRRNSRIGSSVRENVAAVAVCGTAGDDCTGDAWMLGRECLRACGWEDGRMGSLRSGDDTRGDDGELSILPLGEGFASVARRLSRSWGDIATESDLDACRGRTGSTAERGPSCRWPTSPLRSGSGDDAEPGNWGVEWLP